MAYRYGVKNTYRPTSLAPNAFGGTRGTPYSAADVPTEDVWALGGLGNRALLEEQFAYEWFQSGAVEGRGMTNPPFVSGAAGRLHPMLESGGGSARILRGYIRRAEYDVDDRKSKARLYFMYNPEVIHREYVSYLEQSALDPFNTVYQSGNLIAPPSILNFSFELFFDRQEECAQDSTHPGVFVDYQFFDLVVRNVVPSDPNQTNNMIPDNGVMMVNPRDITVIFSPQISVQGRPTNASVTFEKFTHRMTPIRMRIQLQILASYFGPVRDMVEYKAEQLKTEDTIPIGEQTQTVYNISFDAVDRASERAGAGGDFSAGGGAGGGGGGGAGAGSLEDLVNYSGQLGQANDANHEIRLKALAWAMDPTVVIQGGPGAKGQMNAGWTNYTGANSGAGRYTLPAGADCSGLVTEAYIRVGHGKTMGWSGHPGTSSIMSTVKKETSYYVPLSSINWQQDLLPGDILIRDGHVGFFVKYSGSGGCVIFDAASSTINPEVGQRTVSGHSKFTHLLRPTPLGAVGSAAQATSYNSGAGAR